ncbi:MAG: hypothetical protein JW850_14825 [Thermoflexales bacterium]|nr:hypothetical protein [Thermoflexales bacterium]
MHCATTVLSVYKLPVILDPGEIEVLALAQTLQDPLVLLADEVARDEARRLKLRLRGTLGVLVQCREQQTALAEAGSKLPVI